MGDRVTRAQGVTTGLAAGLVLVGGWWLFGPPAIEPIRLIDTFAAAVKRPDAGVFEVTDVAIGGESKRSISIAPGDTRLVWDRVPIPHDAWLSVSIALRPEAFEQEGDGVVFLIGASDGRTYEELFAQHVNPFGHAGDRRWIPLMLDLSHYGGEQIELIFNTRVGPVGSTDARADLAVWGDPAILVR